MALNLAVQAVLRLRSALLSMQRLRPWLALATVLVISALAPVELHAARSYGAGSGLPNLSVTAIARGNDGLVWFGTEDGLVRFDGHRFIDVPLERPGTLADRHVVAMLSMPAGMYVATRRALLVFGADGAPRSVGPDGSDLPNVQGLALGPDGTGYAATSDGQLWSWRGQTPGAGLSAILDTTKSTPQAFTSVAVGSNAIWLGSRNGVFRFDLSARTLTTLRVAAPEIDNGAREARAVVEFPAGTLWVGFWNDALLRVDISSGSHHWYHPGDARSSALRSTSIYAFAAQQGRLYIGSNRGLLVYLPECDCLRGLNLPSWDAIEGSGIIVQSLLAESDGVWAGVFGEGATRFARTDEAFQNQVRVSGRDDRLGHSMVRALHLDADRRLWIGSYGGGVQSVAAGARGEGAPWVLENLEWTAPRIEARYLWSIEGTSEGLLLGTGLGLFELRGGQVTALDSTVERIRSTLQTADGRRYAGTQSGLYRIGAEGLQRIDLSAAGASAPVWSLAERDGELWIGSGNGLIRLRADESVIGLHAPGLALDALPGAVLAQFRAPDRSHWLGTSGGLVLVVDAGELKFEQPAPLQRARVRNVTSIEVDAKGSYWLGTLQGLVRYDPALGRVTRYAQSDGLFGNQFNGGASAFDGERLYFGGMGGMVSFDPAELEEPVTPLRPQLTRIRVGRGDYVHTALLELPANHQPFQLEFSADEHLHPENVRYALRWHGLDERVSELGDATSALVERLPAGAHTLELIATRVDQPDSARSARVLEVRVASAWHESWWGRSAIAGAILLAMFALIQWRTRNARLQQVELEKQVDARTRELNTATEALKQSNAALQEMALQDPLTGLANRRQLFKQAEDWREQGRALSVMMIDLDRFKDCNDRYGHAHGDRVLQEFSRLFRSNVGEQELCARYGGEEFLCLAADADHDALEHAALSLLQAVRRHRIVFDNGQEFGFTISIGLAQANGDESVESTIRRADMALYRAKHSRDAHQWASRELST